MDKYYEPDLKEFHQGFEYESQQMDGDGYYTNEYCEFEYEIGEKIDLNKVRVKYLSQEDIESLGFIVSSDYGAGIEFKFQDRYKLVKVKHEGLTYSKNEIIIFKNNSIFGEDYTSRLFIGNIKNKSELIKLLKQLGIG